MRILNTRMNIDWADVWDNTQLCFGVFLFLLWNLGKLTVVIGGGLALVWAISLCLT